MCLSSAARAINADCLAESSAALRSFSAWSAAPRIAHRVANIVDPAPMTAPINPPARACIHGVQEFTEAARAIRTTATVRVPASRRAGHAWDTTRLSTLRAGLVTALTRKNYARRRAESNRRTGLRRRRSGGSWRTIGPAHGASGPTRTALNEPRTRGQRWMVTRCGRGDRGLISRNVCRRSTTQADAELEDH